MEVRSKEQSNLVAYGKLKQGHPYRIDEDGATDIWVKGDEQDFCLMDGRCAPKEDEDTLVRPINGYFQEI